MKLDAAGSPLWTKAGGSAGIQEATSVAIDTDGNVIVAGSFTGSLDLGGGTMNSTGGSGSDAFVVKYTSAGMHSWGFRYGDSADQFVTAVAVDGGENVIIAGYFQGSMNLGCASGAMTSAGGNDIFVAKFGTGGACIWNQQFGAANDQMAASLAVDGTGNIVLAGECKGSFAMGAGTKDCGSVADVLVAKLDSSGNVLWTKNFGDETFDKSAKAVAVDPVGGVVIAGNFRGTLNFMEGDSPSKASQGLNDVFVSKLGSTGNVIWSRWFGSTNEQRATAIATDKNSNVFVAGSMSSMVGYCNATLAADGTDAFVIGFDSGGACLCGINYSDSAAKVQAGTALATTNAGELVLGIGYDGTVDNLGCGKVVPSASLNDALIVKLKR